MFIEEIIERLNNSYLKQASNEGRIVLDGTVGEYLEHFDPHFLDVFLSTSKGGYLDLLGVEYGVLRGVDESDTDYRNRIIEMISPADTTEDLNKLGVKLWTYNSYIVDELEDEDSTSWHMVSRNTLIRDSSRDYLFIGSAPDGTEDLVSEKLVEEDILWV